MHALNHLSAFVFVCLLFGCNENHTNTDDSQPNALASNIIINKNAGNILDGTSTIDENKLIVVENITDTNLLSSLIDKIKGARELKFSNCVIDNRLMALLSKQERIDLLIFRSVDISMITEETIKNNLNSMQLNELSLIDCKLDSAMLRNLRMPRLRKLSIVDSVVNQLNEVKLIDTHITEIEELTLNGIGLNSSNFPSDSKKPLKFECKSLCLKDNKINDECLRNVSVSADISYLDFEGNAISGTCFKDWPKIELEVFRIRRNKLTDDGLVYLIDFINVKFLDISGNNGISALPSQIRKSVKTIAVSHNQNDALIEMLIDAGFTGDEITEVNDK